MPNSTTDHPLKVMFAGLFSLILAMGIARFSYTPLLPVMINETFLNDATGGWLATINYIGYMLGAIIAASISDLKLKDILYRAGLIIAVVSTVGMGIIDNYLVWSIMRFIAGLSSAACLLVGTGLILNWMIRHGHKPELGVHFAGVGLGISLTAVLSILMLNKFDWAQQWLVFSAIAVLLAIPAWAWLPRPVNHHLTLTGKTLVDKPPEKSWMLLFYAAYFCAGIGYVISATFSGGNRGSSTSLGGQWLASLVNNRHCCCTFLYFMGSNCAKNGGVKSVILGLWYQYNWHHYSCISVIAYLVFY